MCEDRKLGLLPDASFAGDQRDSQSTSGGLVCEFGSHTFVLISRMCEKQTAVSHSSAKSEIISLDADLLRMDGLPAPQFGECVLETLSSRSVVRNLERRKRERFTPSHSLSDTCVFECIDHGPTNIPNNSHSVPLCTFEDNAAVIQMINRGRSSN